MAKQIHTVQVPELAFGGHGLTEGTSQIMPFFEFSVGGAGAQIVVLRVATGLVGASLPWYSPFSEEAWAPGGPLES